MQRVHDQQDTAQATDTAKATATNGRPAEGADILTQVSERVAEQIDAGEVAGIAADHHPYTDVANAERLAQRASGRLLDVHGLGWLTWDGKRWKPAERGEEVREAMEMVRAVYGEAQRSTDSNERKALAGHARRSESARSIRAALDLARSYLPAGVEEFDATPGTLNVENGILDLDTRTLTPHDPAARHTRITAAPYLPDAQAPRFEAFLARVIPDEDERAWVQKAVGASLVGRFTEHLFFCHGGGANGKSTFLRVLRGVLGDYAQEAPQGFLQLRYGDRTAGDEAALARTRGARLVTTAEAEQGRRLAEVLVKELTGEATLSAKLMRQDPIEFENQATYWLTANHKPIIRGMDLAIRRRVKLIPFEVTIPEAERDAGLADKLAAEGAGMLAWAVEGYRRYREEGLEPVPNRIGAATAGYFAEMDPVADWLDECCESGDFTTNADLRTSYERYCEAIGEKHPLSRQMFAEAMDKHGYPAAKRNGKRGRTGIRISGGGLAA